MTDYRCLAYPPYNHKFTIKMKAECLEPGTRMHSIVNDSRKALKAGVRFFQKFTFIMVKVSVTSVLSPSQYPLVTFSAAIIGL